MLLIPSSVLLWSVWGAQIRPGLLGKKKKTHKKSIVSVGSATVLYSR